jgi:hypothetical protein
MRSSEKDKIYSFNARYLTPIEVASSFIINKQFIELMGNNHSLLMGPRGSGKTTMLKMLTPNAQQNWNESQGELPFWAIYIPTDVQWKSQIVHFKREMAEFPNYCTIISKLIVTTNIVIALCETFKQIIEQVNNSDPKNLVLEAKFCKELILRWNLKTPLSPDIGSVRRSLQSRLIEINSHIDRTKYTIDEEKKIEYPDYFFESYFDLIDLGCTIFEDVYSNSNELGHKPFRWALCFDELEIAPDWLQKELLVALRSTHQKFIFKLTTSPLVSLYDKIDREYYQIDAQQDNDYKIIRIWTSTQQDSRNWNEFSKKLIERKIKQYVGEEVNPIDLFGTDKLERSMEEGPNRKTIKIKPRAKPYERGSAIWVLFKELAKNDPSFHSFLEFKEIDPLNPVPKSPEQKSSIYRKIKPLVIYRYHVKKNGKNRSRNVIPLFYGLPYIYELSEGNPRALIGLFDDFISNIKRDEHGKVRRFTINEQSRILVGFSERMLKIISAHPDSHTKIAGTGGFLSLGLILKSIGNYFSYKIINDDFNMDPNGSFLVDENISEHVLNLLKLGLDLGAIVYLDPKEGISDHGLVGKKFKLSYLLYPMFRLPKQELGTQKLSSIIGDQKGILNQTSLFE